MRRTLFDDDHEAFRALGAHVRRQGDRPARRRVGAPPGSRPRELFTAAGAAGVPRHGVPEEYGGGGVADFRFNAVLSEELLRARTRAPGWASPCTTTSACPTSSSYCTDEQKQRWLPGIVSGELSPRSP